MEIAATKKNVRLMEKAKFSSRRLNMKKIKYPRIEKKDRTLYVTGDAQDWTYQYTWEDLEESFNDSSTDVRAMRNIIFRKVRAYFKDHPEEALLGGRFKEGWTAEEVKRLCENSICC